MHCMILDARELIRNLEHIEVSPYGGSWPPGVACQVGLMHNVSDSLTHRPHETLDGIDAGDARLHNADRSVHVALRRRPQNIPPDRCSA